jgi:hypothetical protein
MNQQTFNATLREVELFGKDMTESDYTISGTVKKLADGTFTFTFTDDRDDERTIKYACFDKQKLLFKRNKRHSEHGAKIVSID